jgi:competence protein ComEC
MEAQRPIAQTDGDGARARPGLAARLAAERDRWVLWLPVATGFGIALYFALPSEPPAPVAPAALLAAAVGLVLLRGRLSALAVAAALAAGAAGFGAAQLQTALKAAPVIEKRLGPVRVEGRVLQVDLLPEGRRILAAPAAIGPRAERLPALLRIRVGRGGDALAPGDRFALRAILMPPPAPAMPGAYDFQRQAYFDRIGGVGFAVGPAERAGEAAGGWDVAVATLRHRMTERIMEVLPGGTGGVAAALITGEMGGIPESVNAAFRDSGLAHLLSISGIHMTLVAGIAFVALRALFALVPAIALRLAIKKWAAALAILLVFGYTLLAGAPVPAQRSCVMITLVLLAVIIDRLHLSTRIVAWAALLVMLTTPVGVLGPSFQMSFAAVIALIAFYETFRERIAGWQKGGGAGRRVLLYFVGISLTSAVATVATTPYAVYHFNRFALYALPSNMAAVPITGFWVMPWAMVSCMLMPFGLERWGLVPMGWGVDAIIGVAESVASWPAAVRLVPAMPPSGLVLLTLGGLWICIWRLPWRRWGVVPIALGCASLLATRPPDLIVAADAKLIAARGADGSYMMSAERGPRFAEETWLRRASAEAGEAWPTVGTSRDGSLACDRSGCLYRARGRTVAVVRDPGAASEDCAAADVVIGEIPLRSCRAAGIVIDRIDLWRSGAHAIWLDADGIRVESVDALRGDRPWVPRHAAAAPTAAPRRSTAVNSGGRGRSAGPAP